MVVLRANCKVGRIMACDPTNATEFSLDLSPVGFVLHKARKRQLVGH